MLLVKSCGHCGVDSNRRDSSSLAAAIFSSGGQAIQGLGHVVYAYAHRLHAAGAKLVVADIDRNALERARDELDAEIAPIDSIYDVQADIYAPCALGSTLDLDTLRCPSEKVIAGAANNQLSTADVGELLRQKGVLYAPDFVINSGGIIKVFYKYLNKPEADVEAHVVEIRDTLAEIFTLTDREGCATSVVAHEIAQARLKRW